MPNVNDDVVADYVDVRRALMQANHSNKKEGSVNRTMAHLERYLARPMRVVVLGEHNSGKTALVNSLLGREMLPTAVVANTPVSVTMRFSTVSSIRAQMDCGTWFDIDRTSPLYGLKGRGLRAVEVRAPNPLLKQFELVDTPANNDHKASILGADFVIWCTNASRAWSETERRAWTSLPRRCRRLGVLAVTHSDALVSNSDREKVMQRLQDEAGELFDDILFANGVSQGPLSGADDMAFGGVNGILNYLEDKSRSQRARREQAAERIACRLNKTNDKVPRSLSISQFLPVFNWGSNATA